MASLSAVLLLAATGTFATAMIMYATLLLRMKKPISFFDLPELTRSGISLAGWIYRMWVAAIIFTVGGGFFTVVQSFT